jgi:hypothetical protein
MPEKKKNLISYIARNPWKIAIIAILVILLLFWRSPRKLSSSGQQNFIENRDVIV